MAQRDQHASISLYEVISEQKRSALQTGYTRICKTNQLFKIESSESKRNKRVNGRSIKAHIE